MNQFLNDIPSFLIDFFPGVNFSKQFIETQFNDINWHHLAQFSENEGVRFGHGLESDFHQLNFAVALVEYKLEELAFLHVEI